MCNALTQTFSTNSKWKALILCIRPKTNYLLVKLFFFLLPRGNFETMLTIRGLLYCLSWRVIINWTLTIDWFLLNLLTKMFFVFLNINTIFRAGVKQETQEGLYMLYWFKLQIGCNLYHLPWLSKMLILKKFGNST